MSHNCAKKRFETSRLPYFSVSLNQTSCMRARWQNISLALHNCYNTNAIEQKARKKFSLFIIIHCIKLCMENQVTDKNVSQYWSESMREQYALLPICVYACEWLNSWWQNHTKHKWAIRRMGIGFCAAVTTKICFQSKYGLMCVCFLVCNMVI